jgi:hypothetical protein
VDAVSEYDVDDEFRSSWYCSWIYFSQKSTERHKSDLEDDDESKSERRICRRSIQSSTSLRVTSCASQLPVAGNRKLGPR